MARTPTETARLNEILGRPEGVKREELDPADRRLFEEYVDELVVILQQPRSRWSRLMYPKEELA